MISQTRRSRRADAVVVIGTALAASCLVSGCADEPTPATSAPGIPGMTYDSIARLPDFSGWWQLRLDQNAGGLAVFLKSTEPFTVNLRPEVAERLDKVRSAVFGSGDTSTAPASLPDPVDLGQKPSYCAPLRFVGDNGGFVEVVEFLFTPGRVTITNESGLIRRVFLNQSLPDSAETTYMGTSVGHWDGDTLVVETVGLDPEADAVGLLGAAKLGRGARTVERISLADPDTLELELTLTAPDVYTAPIKAVAVFERVRDYTFRENTFCVTDDRSVDPVTGRQRFDLTPPSDIAPPPQ